MALFFKLKTIFLPFIYSLYALASYHVCSCEKPWIFFYRNESLSSSLCFIDSRFNCVSRIINSLFPLSFTLSLSLYFFSLCSRLKNEMNLIIPCEKYKANHSIYLLYCFHLLYFAFCLNIDLGHTFGLWFYCRCIVLCWPLALFQSKEDYCLIEILSFIVFNNLPLHSTCSHLLINEVFGILIYCPYISRIFFLKSCIDNNYSSLYILS